MGPRLQACLVLARQHSQVSGIMELESRCAGTKLSLEEIEWLEEASLSLAKGRAPNGDDVARDMSHRVLGA